MLGSEMFSTNVESKSHENGGSFNFDMTTRQDNLKVQIPSATPTRNTIRTSPNAHGNQQNGYSNNEKNYANVLNFTEDCNFQGTLFKTFKKKILCIKFSILNS
jgi:hypothetical protein